MPMIGWLTSGAITAALQLFSSRPSSTRRAPSWAGLALTLGQAFTFFYLWYLAHGRGTYSLRSVFRNAKADGGVFVRVYKRLKGQRITSEFGWLIINACCTRMSTYLIITSCATNIGIVQAAVNKTLLDLYVFCGLCAEPIFTVGNVLLPRVRHIGDQLAASRPALFYIAILMGSTVVATAYYICGTSTLSADPNVRVYLDSLKPVVASTTGLACVSYALDGCVIGTEMPNSSPRCKSSTPPSLSSLFCSLKLTFGAAITLQHLWTSLFVFQVLRFTSRTHVEARSRQRVRPARVSAVAA